jgi:hypothetical protein
MSIQQTEIGTIHSISCKNFYCQLKQLLLVIGELTSVMTGDEYENAFVGGLLLNVLILKRNCPQ